MGLLFEGIYKVCHAPNGFGQDDSDFMDQGIMFEVVDSVLTGASTLSTDSIHYVDIALYGGSSGDFVALLDRSLSKEGCIGSVSARTIFECSEGIGIVQGYDWEAYCVFHTPPSLSKPVSLDYKVCWA